MEMALQETLDKIQQIQDSLSATQRQVAAYVLENYHLIPFLSITALARNIGVSNNSVIKFCNQLGYDKFAEFKKMFSEYAHSELVMYNKLSDSEETASDNSLFAMGLGDDTAAIRATLTDPSNQQNLPQLLEMMERAKHIYITGGRVSGMMADIFANILRYLGLKVFSINFAGDYLDRLSMVEPEDLVIALSFPRYTAQVVDGIRDLHEAGIPIALITDTGLSPCHPYADLAFHCSIASGYYFPSYAGCLSLISLICRAMGADRKKGAAQHIHQLESHLLERGVFL